jgi:hypothetical protein
VTARRARTDRPGEQRGEAVVTWVGDRAGGLGPVELRGKRIAAGSTRDRCQRPEQSGLNGGRRPGEADHIAVLPRDRRQL